MHFPLLADDPEMTCDIFSGPVLTVSPVFLNVTCQGGHVHLKQKFHFWVELRLNAWYTKKVSLKCATGYSIYRLNLIHTSQFTLKQHSVAILQP